MREWSFAVVYYMDRIEQMQDAEIDALMPYVSSERLARAQQYRFRSDRVQSLLAFVLLRVALHLEYDCRRMPRLAVTAEGKPYLADMQGIHFNLSHCKKGVACGVADSALGVDIQHYVPFKEALAKRVLTRQELSAVKAGDADMLFTRLWTRKESYGKYTGRGICYDMPSFPVREGALEDGSFCQSHVLEDFVISVTAAEPQRLIRLDTAELPERCRLLETRWHCTENIFPCKRNRSPLHRRRRSVFDCHCKKGDAHGKLTLSPKTIRPTGVRYYFGVCA